MFLRFVSFKHVCFDVLHKKALKLKTKASAVCCYSWRLLAALGPSWAAFGRSWAALGLLLAALGRSWVGLGASLGRSWVALGRS